MKNGANQMYSNRHDTNTRVLGLKAGEAVIVRSSLEILATLDDSACLERLPFMPQMAKYCGQKFKVRARAHKMCDTAFGTGALRMNDAVFLDDVACDGAAYGGCEMACSIVWKEAWLRRAEPAEIGTASPADIRLDAIANSMVRRSTVDEPGAPPVFICQATKIPSATTPLPWWKARQYIVDYTSGNVPIKTLLARVSFVLYAQLVNSGLGFGSALRWTYTKFQQLRGGVEYPIRKGHLPAGGPTPAAQLGLQVGELVRVKPLDEILKTVDERLFNRGMSFHPEMVPYCGKTYRVKQRVKKIINEKNGQLLVLKNSCIILDGVGCYGRFSMPVNCPRGFPPYWREIWLERVEAAPQPGKAEIAEAPTA